MLDRASDDFSETDHPRASNGQFGSGSAVHVVTTAGSADSEVRAVTDDGDEASDTRDAIEDDEGDNSAEHHAVPLERSGDGPVSAVHIVHGPDGSGGSSVYGAYDDHDIARGHAVAQSRDAWDADGPDRADLDRDEGEEDEAAERWNEDHADDDGAVLAKTTDAGAIDRDASGALQWVQDGEDVEPDDDHDEAFGEHFDGMFPGDERGAYPGFDAANDHFEAADQGENVFRIHTHKVGGVFAKDGAMRRNKDLIALDRKTVRRVDADGHLHVERTPISKACVNGYIGREIPGWQGLGLKGDRIYRMWRHPEELEKAVPSAAGKPLFMGHRAVSAVDHDHENNVGGVTDPKWEPPYVTAAMDVWPQTAIDAIESKEHAEISSAYRYTPDMTAGTTPDGERYDGIMRDIDFSHVALVPEGRAGKDVRVHDAAPRKLKDILMTAHAANPARQAAKADAALIGGLMAGVALALRPRLAADAKLNLNPVFKGVTAKNLKSRTPALAKAVAKAAKGLAADADVSPDDAEEVLTEVGQMLIEQAPDIAASVADPAEPMPPDGGEDAPDMSALMSFLDGKLSDEDMAKVKTMCGKGDDADAEDARRKRLPVTPSAQDDKNKPPVITKPAMDAAIAQARKDAAADAMKAANAIRDAERFVRPYVGEIAIACDSAEAIHRAALDILEVKHDGKHPDALADIVEVHGQAAQAAKSPRRMAQDAAPKGIAYDTTSFPNSGRLKV